VDEQRLLSSKTPNLIWTTLKGVRNSGQLVIMIHSYNHAGKAPLRLSQQVFTLH
jgi:hypothetical protein